MWGLRVGASGIAFLRGRGREGDAGSTGWRLETAVKTEPYPSVRGLSKGN